MKIEDTSLNYYEVGGSVRDELLYKRPKDRDFVIVGHTLDEVQDAGLDRVVGEDFPVFLDAEGRECAMARTEESIERGHQGFSFNTSPEITIEEDLERRDLTINAMAKNPNTGEIIDPYSGRHDLKHKQIRATSDAFGEDPLRVLRAARFAARFNFNVVPSTARLCSRLSGDLQALSEERVAAELKKALVQAEKPSLFFDNLKAFDALNAVFPELQSLVGVPAGPAEYHQEEDSYRHTMMVLDAVESPYASGRWGTFHGLIEYGYDEERETREEGLLRVRLAALAHDLGKARTPEDTLPNHYGHDQEGEVIAQRMANRLRLSNKLRGVMMDAAAEHMRFHKLGEMRASKQLRLVERMDRSPSHITPEELVELMVADGLGRKPQKEHTSRGLHEGWVAPIQVARSIITEIGGEEVLALHPDKEAGEWVGDRILELRTKAFQDSFKMEKQAGDTWRMHGLRVAGETLER